MRTCTNRIVTWALVTAAASTATALQAQDRPASGESATLDHYEVGTALPPQDPGTELVPMTLGQAIDRALEMNLDIATARISPRMQEYSVRAARAVYTPTFNGNYGYNNATNQSTSQLDGGTRTTTERHTFDASVDQSVPWYGGRLGLGFQNTRTSTDNRFATLNPSYRSTVSLQYNQPLLAGLKTDNQRATIETEEIQGQITGIQLDQRVRNITESVRQQYWLLRAAIEQIEIQRRSLAQSRQLLADNQVRVRLGTMAQIQVIQAEAQVASAEQALLNAEVQWRSQELVFKSLIIGGADDPLLYQTINPTELPTIVDQEVDLQAAIEIALAERTDIRQSREERRAAEVDLDVSANNRLPDLNLTASYSLLGVGGTELDRSGLGGAPVVVQQGGYLDGINSIVGLDTPTWSVGVSFSYPIGMRAQKANLERARLAMEQRDLAIRSQELAIVTEVTNAGLAVRDTRLQLDAAVRSRELAEQSLEAEVTRFTAGVATNFEVLTAQDDLTTARLSELRAVITHVNAIDEFERVQRVGR